MACFLYFRLVQNSTYLPQLAAYIQVISSRMPVASLLIQQIDSRLALPVDAPTGGAFSLKFMLC